MISVSISPSWALLILLAILYGALFHLLRGRKLNDLLIYVPVAFVGLALGQLIGQLLGLDVLRIGTVYLLEGTVLAWVGMFAAAWLKG